MSRLLEPNPQDPEGAPLVIPTMTLGLVLGRDTRGEQRVTFMVLEMDYEALGRPGFGDEVDVTLTTKTP
jgi:hypothetical protein